MIALIMHYELGIHVIKKKYVLSTTNNSVNYTLINNIIDELIRIR